MRTQEFTAISLRVLSTMLCLHLLPSTLAAEVTIDELFALSATTPENWEVASASDEFRWKDEKVDIAIFVAGKEKAQFLRSLHEEFEKDANFLSAKSGKTIEIKLWSLGQHNSSIYVFAGSKQDIVEWGPKLDELFEGGFSTQISDLLSQKGFLCFSSVKLGHYSEIERSVIVVDRNDHPNYCLRRHLIHSFGLVGELPAGVNSILAEDKAVEFYSQLDSVLLKMLYLSERHK